MNSTCEVFGDESVNNLIHFDEVGSLKQDKDASNIQFLFILIIPFYTDVLVTFLTSLLLFPLLFFSFTIFFSIINFKQSIISNVHLS